MKDLNTSARKTLSHHETAYVDGFDTLLRDVVHDHFAEDEQLRALAAAHADAEAALLMREETDAQDGWVSPQLEKGTQRLSWVIEQRAAERVAEICERVATEADHKWLDVHDEETVRAAHTEAREWLETNTNAAERAGVDYGSALPDVDELLGAEEVSA